MLRPSHLSLIPLLAMLTGCLSALPPTARVTGARVLDETDEGARVVVILELQNPNTVPLPLPDASYRVVVDGVGTYAFDDLPVRVIPPGGTQTVTLPAAVAATTDDGLPAAMPDTVAGRRWRIRGTLTYRPDNGIRRFLTETGIPLPTVAFAGRGTLEN